MKLWITSTKAVDGGLVKQAWGSQTEARTGVGDTANGTAMFVDVAADKAGVIAIFNGAPKILSTEKTFDIRNGKWHTRVSGVPVSA